jgi:hypothetical protein
MAIKNLSVAYVTKQGLSGSERLWLEEAFQPLCQPVADTLLLAYTKLGAKEGHAWWLKVIVMVSGEVLRESNVTTLSMATRYLTGQLGQRASTLIFRAALMGV